MQDFIPSRYYQLPDELWSTIIDQLELKDRARLAMVCRKFNQLVNSSYKCGKKMQFKHRDLNKLKPVMKRFKNLEDATLVYYPFSDSVASLDKMDLHRRCVVNFEGIEQLIAENFQKLKKVTFEGILFRQDQLITIVAGCTKLTDLIILGFGMTGRELDQVFSEAGDRIKYLQVDWISDFEEPCAALRSLIVNDIRSHQLMMIAEKCQNLQSFRAISIIDDDRSNLESTLFKFIKNCMKLRIFEFSSIDEGEHSSLSDVNPEYLPKKHMLEKLRIPLSFGAKEIKMMVDEMFKNLKSFHVSLQTLNQRNRQRVLSSIINQCQQLEELQIQRGPEDGSEDESDEEENDREDGEYQENEESSASSQQANNASMRELKIFGGDFDPVDIELACSLCSNLRKLTIANGIEIGNKLDLRWLSSKVPNLEVLVIHLRCQDLSDTNDLTVTFGRMLKIELLHILLFDKNYYLYDPTKPTVTAKLDMNYKPTETGKPGVSNFPRDLTLSIDRHKVKLLLGECPSLTQLLLAKNYLPIPL